MMGGVYSFFSFIISPIRTFVSEVFTDFQAVTNYILNFFTSFLNGIVNILQAMMDMINSLANF